MAKQSEQAAGKGLVPRLRFREFVDAGEWLYPTLGSITDPIEERVGDRELTPISISAGIGFVPQAEKFGRDISGDQYSRYKIVQDGDFVYNKGNSKNFPQGCVYDLQDWGEVAAPNVFICFRLKQGYVNGFYRQCFENNAHGVQLRRYITSSARSNGLLNISRKTFFGIRIPTPKCAEQQKIADCLSSLDERIAFETRRHDALKTHKQGLLQQLFPRENETVPRLRFRGFRLNWKESPLHALAVYKNGKAYEQDIHNNGRYVVVNSRFISTDGVVRKYSNATYCLAGEDDILMVLSDLPNGRALAKCFYVSLDNKYAVNQRVARLTPTDIYSKFLYYRLNRHHKLLAFDDGLTQTHLSKSNVTDCPLLAPLDQAEQQKIADCLTSLDDLIAAQAKKIDLLKQHKRGLMQQLFPVLDGAAA